MSNGFADRIKHIESVVEELSVRGPVRTISFPEDPQYRIPPETRTIARKAVYPSNVARIVIHWPPGTEALVGTRIYIGENEERQLLPEREGDLLAKDNATVSYDVDYDIEDTKDIFVEWENKDQEHEHRVPVDILYVLKKDSPEAEVGGD